MITRDEVIALADECVFDIVEPDEYHDKREVVDSGNLWITERMERFAAACYRKGVEDSAKVCEKMDVYYFDGYEDRHNLPDDCAYEIRKLIADTDNSGLSDGAIVEQG